jgi:hypothetical protein
VWCATGKKRVKGGKRGKGGKGIGKDRGKESRDVRGKHERIIDINTSPQTSIESSRVSV